MARDKQDGKRRRNKSGPPKPWSVLVVSPTSDGSEVAVRLLAQHDYQVARATDEHEAATALAHHEFQCVVLDGAGGTSADHLKISSALRSHEVGQVARVPIVLLADSDTNEIFSWQNGVDGFLIRPFPAQTLLDEVEAAVLRSPAERRAHRAESLARAESTKRRPVPVTQPWQTFKL